jgi:hypothetical protein
MVLILLGSAGGLFGCYLLYDLLHVPSEDGKESGDGLAFSRLLCSHGQFPALINSSVYRSIIRERFRLFCYLAWLSGLVFSYTFFRHDFWEPFFLILNVALAVMQFVYVRLAYACLKSPSQ